MQFIERKLEHEMSEEQLNKEAERFVESLIGSDYGNDRIRAYKAGYRSALKSFDINKLYSEFREEYKNSNYSLMTPYDFAEWLETRLREND